MDRNNERLMALNLLKLSSLAYLEAREKHGEAGAVAACSELFNDYHNTISSKEYVAAAPKQTTKHIPLSGLNAANLDDFFKPPPCSGQFESCKAREVNDSDVKAFVKKVSQPPQKKDARLSKDVNKHKPAAAKGSKSDIPQSSNDSSRKRKDEADPLAFLKKFSQPPQKSTAPKTNVQPPSKLTLLDKINNSLSKRPNPSPQLSSGASTVAQPSNPPPKLQQQPANDRPPANNRPDDKPDKSYMYAGFKSSTSEYHLQRSKKNSNSNNDQFSRQAEPPQKKRLGMHAINPQYKSPVVQQPPAVSGEPMQIDDDDESNHPLLKGIDPKLIDQIKTEIVASGSKIDWNDIAGLDEVKMEIQEAVTLPLECPWLFSGNGMLKLEKGILLFGPPGTGKTLIAKCVSAQCQATFFSISASSLTSKWIGEGEKLVKALFAYARVKQPSVIFIDEVDSILTKRGDNDHESSTRLKTEFMIQLDGANSTKENDRILVIGATNRPQKLDEAVIRRFSKRFFIPLPDLESRATLLSNLLRGEHQNLNSEDVLRIAELTDGYSGADLREVGSQAAKYRIREIRDQKRAINQSNIRPVSVGDFINSLKQVKATVSSDDIQQYTDWANKVGSN